MSKVQETREGPYAIYKCQHAWRGRGAAAASGRAVGYSPRLVLYSAATPCPFVVIFCPIRSFYVSVLVCQALLLLDGEGRRHRSGAAA